MLERLWRGATSDQDRLNDEEIGQIIACEYGEGEEVAPDSEDEVDGCVDNNNTIKDSVSPQVQVVKWFNPVVPPRYYSESASR